MIRVGFNVLNQTDNAILGTGRFARNLILGLVNSGIVGERITIVLFIQNKVDPAIFGVQEDQRKETGLEIVRVADKTSRMQRILFEQFQLPGLLKKHRIDVYVSTTPGGPWFTGIDIPSMVTIHDLTPFIIKGKYGFGRDLYYKSLAKMGAKKADKVVTVSASSKADILKYTKAKADKIEIIQNFITGLDAIPETGYEPFFLSVGTIQPGKNLINSMIAFDLFVRKSGNTHFKYLITGKEGWKTEEIYYKREELEFGENIRFLGYVDDTELMESYKNCAGLLSVSLYEGFGIPPLEAMYYEKPSVVSNVSSLPEVVGPTGIHVDPNYPEAISDALIQILNPKTRAELQSHIPGQIEKFREQAETEKFIDLIYHLARHQNSRQAGPAT